MSFLRFDHATSAPLAAAAIALVVAALGGTTAVVVQDMAGDDQEFHATAFDTILRDGRIELVLVGGEAIPTGLGRVVVEAGVEKSETPLTDFSSIASGGVWTVGESICLIGAACLVENETSASIRVIARDQLMFETSVHAFGSSSGSGGSQGGSGAGDGDDADDEDDDGALDGNQDDGNLQVCHKPNTPAEKTMNLNYNAWSGHAGHGDTLGPCNGDEADDDGLLVICHMPNLPAEQTKTIPYVAWTGHAVHGDTVGAC